MIRSIRSSLQMDGKLNDRVHEVRESGTYVYATSIWWRNATKERRKQQKKQNNQTTAVDWEMSLPLSFSLSLSALYSRFFFSPSLLSSLSRIHSMIYLSSAFYFSFSRRCYFCCILLRRRRRRRRRLSFFLKTETDVRARVCGQNASCARLFFVRMFYSRVLRRSTHTSVFAYVHFVGDYVLFDVFFPPVLPSFALPPPCCRHDVDVNSTEMCTWHWSAAYHCTINSVFFSSFFRCQSVERVGV